MVVWSATERSIRRETNSDSHNDDSSLFLPALRTHAHIYSPGNNNSAKDSIWFFVFFLCCGTWAQRKQFRFFKSGLCISGNVTANPRHRIIHRSHSDRRSEYTILYIFVTGNYCAAARVWFSPPPSPAPIVWLCEKSSIDFIHSKSSRARHTCA